MRTDDWSPHLPPDSASIPKKQFKTYWALALFADSKTNRCHPSLDTISELVGCARSNVVRDINALVENGHVKKIGYYGRAREYELSLRGIETSRGVTKR